MRLFRKSVKAGPLRLNFSKSGIGASVGVKGFRVGTGPRGNYVSLSMGGVRVRRTLPAPEPASPIHTPAIPPTASSEPLQEIESGSVLQMIDSNSAELLEELNSKRKLMPLLPVAIVVAAVGFLLLASSEAPGWLTGSLLLIGVILSVVARNRDRDRKTTVMQYEMDEPSEKAYRRLHDAFEQLRSCRGAWHVEATGAVKDRKYHAGAATLVGRKPIRLVKRGLPDIQTNLEVPTLPVGRQLLAFLPDRLLVFEPGGVGTVSYANLRIEVSTTRFIEDLPVPGDAQIVGSTWKYVNRSGGPDRRFKDNRQLPIALYEEIAFESPSGLRELLQFSRVGCGAVLQWAVQELRNQTRMGERVA